MQETQETQKMQEKKETHFFPPQSYQIYVNAQDVTIVLNTQQLNAPVCFYEDRSHLMIKDQSRHYCLSYLGEETMGLLKDFKGTLVEVGDGKMFARHTIELSAVPLA